MSIPALFLACAIYIPHGEISFHRPTHFLNTHQHDSTSAARIFKRVAEDFFCNCSCDFINKYDDFYTSMQHSSDDWNKNYIIEISNKHLSPVDYRLEYMMHIPNKEEYAKLSVVETELLASVAYERGNISCLEYILRTKLSLSDRQGTTRLSEEVRNLNRAKFIALFLLYEPMTRAERNQCIIEIISKNEIEKLRTILYFYTLYRANNIMRGDRLPKTISPNERVKFFNEPILHVF